jgi:uncharacterized membrane protein
MLGKHTLKPEEKINLRIVFNTDGLPGPFRKTVTLTTDIPDQEEIEVTIKGIVKEAPAAKIKVTPRRINLGGIKEGSETKCKVAISSTGTLPLTITRIFIKSTGTHLFAPSKGEEMVIHPGQQHTVEFTLKAGKSAAEQDFIVIESNAKNAAKGGYLIMIRNDSS